LLTLQTGVLVRDPDTNQRVPYVQTQPMPNATADTPAKYQVYSDVQLGVIGQYDDNGKIVNVTILDADPLNRAQYYLNGLALQYLPSGGQIAEYNGLLPISVDGAIQQVTWSVGPDGCSTTAGRNTEHDYRVPGYPARRFFELLPPVQQLNLNANRDAAVLKPAQIGGQ